MRESSSYRFIPRRQALSLAALGLGGLVCACRRGGPSRDSAVRLNTPTRPPTSPPAASASPFAPGELTPPPGDIPTCLVTKEQALSQSYVPPDLVTLPARISASDGVQLRRVAADAVVKLVDGAAADRQTIFAISGYRSYEDQARVLRQEIETFGRQVAEQQVAPAGHSEHQLGLASDITSAKAPYELRTEMGDEPEGRWLVANAPRFGFVISYPKGKEAVTGYTYEPWHIRHVGQPLAEQVAASGLTLTEYLPKYHLTAPCP